MLKVLIVEDEIQNAEELLLLLGTWPQKYHVAGILRSNKELRRWFDENQAPDLMFCDIELLDGNVFQTLKENIVHCPIIFTTAYDSYYQQAFDSTGIAYLLKPVGLQKLQAALDKVAQLGLDTRQYNRLDVLFEALNKAAKNYRERILVNTAEGMKLISVKQIVHIETNEGICLITYGNGVTYTIRCKLSELYEGFDPDQFFMINRGEIINVEFIEKIEPYFNDRLAITLKKHAKKVITSKAQTPAFRKWIS